MIGNSKTSKEIQINNGLLDSKYHDWINKFSGNTATTQAEKEVACIPVEVLNLDLNSCEEAIRKTLVASAAVEATVLPAVEPVTDLLCTVAAGNDTIASELDILNGTTAAAAAAAVIPESAASQAVASLAVLFPSNPADRPPEVVERARVAALLRSREIMYKMWGDRFWYSSEQKRNRRIWGDASWHNVTDDGLRR